MPDDAGAFMPPEGQSEYAFPAGQGAGDDDVSQSDQRNRQIQTAFDSQRFQRGMAQNLFKALSSQSSQIAELRQRQAQQKT
jgi:hypothetical protein